MIVYHGSTEIIKNPDVVHSKKYLGILYYNFRKSGEEMGSPKGHETGKGCNS